MVQEQETLESVFSTVSCRCKNRSRVGVPSMDREASGPWTVLKQETSASGRMGRPDSQRKTGPALAL